MSQDNEYILSWLNCFKDKLYQIKRFIRFVAIHFLEDDCPYRASALAFTSLLAIVPLMTVGFAILSAFPVFDNLSQPVQNFIFENFVPTTGKVVQNYLLQFATQVSRLSVFGVTFLFIAAILLMFTIERAMNKIWRTQVPRHGAAAFLLYWAILSLSPVFLGLSLAASSYLLSLLFFQNAKAPSILLSLLPPILSLIGFTFLYVVVPNRPVKISHGLIGALVATLLFEAAKRSFAFYLSRYSSYELLYGAFAIIPIFFLWIYWVWLITLLGAEVSYALAVHYQRRSGEPLDGFSHALLWLQQLWVEQKKGGDLTFNQLIESTDQPFIIDGDAMLLELKRLNLIHTTETGCISLSRDLNDISLYWLSHHLPYSLPNQENGFAHHFVWYNTFIKNDKQLQQTLSISLAELFSQVNQRI